jgi:hypothetical protein
MKPLWAAVVIALAGLAVLTLLVNALDPGTPPALNAFYNLWLLGTVVVLVVGTIGACFRLFERITGHRRLL